jgi:hypothetical protein
VCLSNTPLLDHEDRKPVDYSNRRQARSGAEGILHGIVQKNGPFSDVGIRCRCDCLSLEN